MIQEIKVKNFLSFKDGVTLSFEATKDTFADERIMRKSIRDRLTSGVRIKEIWIRDEGVLTLFFKNTEGQ